MSAPAPEAGSDDDIAAKLAASLESTRDGLNAFAKMVDASRMREALPQYEQLASVLVQQRTWATAGNRPALDEPFAEVADAARRLHEVFSGYAATFERIAQISHSTEPTRVDV